ncbi:MAG TPA: porin family protein [Roseibacterium sp.]|nr:porin family protein [Roseibacterium sp.]
MRIALTARSLVLATPAFAGGYAEPTPRPPVAIAPDATPTWDGWYVGISGSYGDGTSGVGALPMEGNFYGVFGGYRFDIGNVVLGVEWSYDHGFLELNGSSIRGLESIARSGAQIGYDAGAFLPYASFGMAMARLEDPTPPPGFDSTGLGYYYGLGVDYMVTDAIMIGAEFMQHQFDNDFPLVGQSVEVNTFSLNAAFRF